MADKKQQQEAWVAWTHDAVANYVMPDDIENADDLADDMVEVATAFADMMMDEFEERFGGGEGRRRKRRKRSRSNDDEETD